MLMCRLARLEDKADLLGGQHIAAGSDAVKKVW